MHLRLTCHYVAVPGHRLQVVVADQPVDLAWSEGHWWSASVDVAGPYRYRLVDTDGVVVVRESGPAHDAPPAASSDAVVVDRWQVHDPVRPARRSTLFSRAMAVHHAPGPDAGHLRGRVPPAARARRARRVAAGRGRVRTGARAVATRTAPRSWRRRRTGTRGGRSTSTGTSARPTATSCAAPTGQVVWETGEDRRLPAGLDGPATVVDEAFAGRPGWRGGGVAVPVFALRGEHSVGAGTFGDLPAFVDWAADAGLAVVQLLPVNDTVAVHGWDDSYPYDPVSVHALHPLYVDLLDLPGAESVADAVAMLRDELDAPRHHRLPPGDGGQVEPAAAAVPGRPAGPGRDRPSPRPSGTGSGPTRCGACCATVTGPPTTRRGGRTRPSTPTGSPRWPTRPISTTTS